MCRRCCSPGTQAWKALPAWLALSLLSSALKITDEHFSSSCRNTKWCCEADNRLGIKVWHTRTCREQTRSALAAQFLLLKKYIANANRQKVLFSFVFPKEMQHKYVFIVKGGTHAAAKSSHLLHRVQTSQPPQLLLSQHLITRSSQEKPPDVKSEPLVHHRGYSHVQI